jgi:hypothetical protein
MQIELTEEQCGELQSVLENSLDELGDEIADGDDTESLPDLRHRRDVLESILFQIDNPPRAED